ncbi:hypothetical protein B0H16DRAFT_727733 [Mycena metata]|uniref:MYND-type domain-containing protein n=1 Tax=Mycena metata TaxID=1033252 RepID=A0AAD7K9B1_9AGAR|nr:hypothetical protein B0H16DRAFT_727733 [Mycena metata]
MSTIHPSLLAGNISKLRSSLRPTAYSAINGSFVDVGKLYTILNSLPEEQASGVLPVFYANLEPTLIPNLDVIDRIVDPSTSLPSVDNAVSSLSGLCTLASKRYPFLLDAAWDLWPRVLKWLEFLHTYWTCLPGRRTTFEQRVHRVGHASLLLRLADHEPTGTAIKAIPGFRRIVAGAWATMLHYDVHDSPGFFAPRPKLVELTRHLFAMTDDIHTRRNFEEILDAFGGSFRDLVAALRKHISHAVSEAKSQIAVGALNAALIFLQHREGRHHDLTPSLLSGGIITSLVLALEIDGSAPPVANLPHQIVDLDLALLVEYIKLSPGYTGIEEALEAGLLRYLLAFTEKMVQPSRHGMYDDLQDLLCAVLPSGLVSHPILMLMKDSIPQFATAVLNPKFRDSALFEDWITLTEDMLVGRLEVMDAWDARGRPSYLACDNMRCGKIHRKTELKRCGACQIHAYCSSDCQRDDWHRGHRTVCSDLREARLNLHQMLRPRERAFLRALLHADYRRLQFQISLDTISFIHSHPGEPYFVLFDYSETVDVKAEVCSRTTLAPNECAGQWARAARSGGRMTIHIMRIAMGKLNQQLVLPLRAETPRLQQGLHRIASTVDELSRSQIEALLRVLLQTAEREGQEIH